MSVERGTLLKSRAEDFARHLTSRLSTLGGGQETVVTGGWVEENAEVYYNIDSSLVSPEEELAQPIFIAAQNRDGLSLQRSESAGSEYFDSVEEQPQPNLKKIPILHLKTEKPITTLTNGHTIIDADLGCSRVTVMPCEEVESCSTEKSCDIDNNNTWTDVEDVVDKIDKIDLDLLHSGGDAVSLDSNSHNGAKLPDNETTSCVFCDIEQAKSNFNCTESNVLQKEDQSGSVNSAEKEPDKPRGKEKILSQLLDKYSSEAEESIPLIDLLKVLKNEITREAGIVSEKVVKDTDLETTNSVPSRCPNIELRESTPTEDAIEKDEEFDIETKRKNFRRCSSLKSGKTPPGTPGRKKIVRFADVLGLDLTDTKTFKDEVPTIPQSAYSDLQLPSDADSMFAPISSPYTPLGTPQRKMLVPLFPQPFLSPNFMDRVMASHVCLESASVSDMNFFAVTGVVRVRNIDFHKSVYIRYSINGWKSFADLQARYVPNSCDGFSDKFSFLLYAHTLNLGQTLEFAVRYHTSGTQFWDSNGGRNYKFECIQQPLPTPEIPPSPVEIWASFL